MRNLAKRGFTIVEMLVVLGVIAVLLGIVTATARTAIKHARTRKAEAVRQVIQSGISTYRVQTGEWPGVIKTLSENGLSDGEHTRQLSDTDYDKVLSELVEMSVKQSKPLMDVSGIVVTPKGGKGNWGVEFREAIKKEHRHGGGIKLANMAFGYLTTGGTFSRCHIVYNADTDYVTVNL